MSITLSVGATTLELHHDLFWSDEHAWHKVEQTVERSVTGALIIQHQERLDGKGRPITLEPYDDSSAWMPFATLAQLRNWAAVPGQVMTLTLRGVTYSVMFRHQDGSALDADPVVFYNSVANEDFFRVTIRLMVV